MFLSYFQVFLNVKTSFVITMILLTLFPFTNNIIWYILSIYYPIFYWDSAIDENNKVKTCHQYWVIFWTITLIELLFGYLFYHVPVYPHLKIGFIYYLIMYDFKPVEYIYNLIKKYITYTHGTIVRLFNSDLILSKNFVIIKEDEPELDESETNRDDTINNKND